MSIRRLIFLIIPVIPWLSQGAEKYTIEPRPGWAQPLEIAEPTEIDAGKLSAGIYHLASDRHIRVATSEEYGMFASKLVNAHGVQNGSEIKIEFDPAYETLALHSVDIGRNGKWIPRLSPDIVEVLQRENSMENFLVSGRLTVVIRLPDVQPGDILRYEFTRRGANPVMNGHFSTSFWVAAVEPRGLIRLRVENDPSRPLKIKGHGKMDPPPMKREGNLIEWSIPEPEIVVTEDSIPHHMTVVPWIELSDMTSWSEVVDWALPLYGNPGELPPDLMERLRGLKGGKTQVAAAALRIVQDEVRYLGQSGGIYGFQPRAAAEVWAKRAGDCKEKVQLLRKMLSELDIVSHPVLVNSQWGEGIRDWLPSPYQFDHVILEIETLSGAVFVDPTRSFQRGPLEQIYVPDYVLGLRILDGENALCEVRPGPDAYGQLWVSESIVVPDPESAEPAKLLVKTNASGRQAESLRAYFGRDSIDNISRNYMEFYARRYPLIRCSSPLAFKDNPKLNVIEVQESYEIPEFWSKSPEGVYQSVIRAVELESRLVAPEYALRKWPFAIRYPEDFQIHTYVEMPSDWVPPKINHKVSNPWFEYSYWSSGKGRSIIATGKYFAKVPAIVAEDVPAYYKEVERAREASGFELTYRPSSGRGLDHWWLPLRMILGALLGFFGMAAFGIVLAASRPPLKLPACKDPALNGISGWLILAAFAIVISPFLLIVGLAGDYLPLFLGQKTFVFADPSHTKHALWVFGMVSFAALNGFLLAACFVQAALFFLKKWCFPQVFIGISIINLMVLASVGCFEMLLDPSLNPSVAFAEFAAFLPGKMIWIPYMLVSKRVKATFRH